MNLIYLSVTKRRLLNVVMLYSLIVCHQVFAVSNKTDSHQTNANSTIQEGKLMTTKGLGMPAGKRVGPEDVTPVTVDGIRYEALHWGRERGLEQNGGYIVALDAASGKELWTAKIYTIDYKPMLETDVQDIFIQTIKVSDDKKTLKIIDENNREFLLDLSSKKVITH
jgi:hypothetical protein